MPAAVKPAPLQSPSAKQATFVLPTPAGKDSSTPKIKGKALPPTPHPKATSPASVKRPPGALSAKAVQARLAGNPLKRKQISPYFEPIPKFLPATLATAHDLPLPIRLPAQAADRKLALFPTEAVGDMVATVLGGSPTRTTRAISKHDVSQELRKVQSEMGLTLPLYKDGGWKKGTDDTAPVTQFCHRELLGTKHVVRAVKEKDMLWQSRSGELLPRPEWNPRHSVDNIPFGEVHPLFRRHFSSDSPFMREKWRGMRPRTPILVKRYRPPRVYQTEEEEEEEV
mmetsp:Transcript_56323/g.123377  ORF Transcript_56323/g.123377 Transcript_56323/m.123377 type:complete len:283 (+) Transcript_56323:39-887(+)